MFTCTFTLPLPITPPHAVQFTARIQSHVYEAPTATATVAGMSALVPVSTSGRSDATATPPACRRGDG